MTDFDSSAANFSNWPVPVASQQGIVHRSFFAVSFSCKSYCTNRLFPYNIFMGRVHKNRDSRKRLSRKGAGERMSLAPEELIRHGWMGDRTPVTLRSIQPEDAPALCVMFRACSPKSLYLRFERQLNEIPLDQAIQLCSVDHKNELAIVAEIKEAGSHRLIGLGQLSADPDRATAEYAVLVADPWQGKGLGSKFTDFCLEIAWRWGIKRVVGEFSPSNVRIIRILQSRGFRFQRDRQEQVVFAEKTLEGLVWIAKRGEAMSNMKWRKSLRPLINEAREELAKVNPQELARRGGLTFHEGWLELPLLGRVYSIRWPELSPTAPNGEACPEELQILLLDYLKNGDGAPPTGRWIGFRELPDGGFYWRAFQGYSGDQLVRDLGGDVEAFHRASITLGGETLDMGDASYTFRALPQLPMAVVWWAGDEEFPAKASALFDETASHYLPTDGLAILGRMLCRKLAKLGREA